eukprot:jgi/Chrpa1/25672/Chrysochromulina_OHIO_Genome00007743-RA
MLPFVSSSCSINAEEGVACAWVGLHEGERWVRLTSPDEQRLDAAAAEDPTATVAMLGGRVRLGARLEPGAAEACLRLDGDSSKVIVGAIHQRYLARPPLPISRSRWCYTGTNGLWTPFSRDDDAALEALLQQLLQPREGGPVQQLSTQRRQVEGKLSDWEEQFRHLHARVATDADRQHSKQHRELRCLLDDIDALIRALESRAPPAAADASPPSPSAMSAVPGATGAITVLGGAYRVNISVAPGTAASGGMTSSITSSLSSTITISLSGASSASGSGVRAAVSAMMTSTAEVVTWGASLWGASSCSIGRGWAGESRPAPSEDEIRYEQTRPATLAFVVHGVGESLWSTTNPFNFNEFNSSVDKLRANAAKSAAFAQTLADEAAGLASKECTGGISGGGGSGGGSGGGGGAPLSRVEFLGVGWHHSKGGDAWRRRMASVTLPSIPTLRLVTNEVLCDVLLYEQPSTRAAIQLAVVRGINELVHAWRRYNPGFDESGGRYILIGHSLGSLISFDVLCSLGIVDGTCATPHPAVNAPHPAVNSVGRTLTPGRSLPAAARPAAWESTPPPATPPPATPPPAMPPPAMPTVDELNRDRGDELIRDQGDELAQVVAASATSAWYAALPGAHDDAHAPDEDIDGSGHGAAPSKSGPSKLGHSKLGGATVRVEALLEAFSHTLKIFEAFGPLLLLVVKNDEANLEKMQRAWRDLEAADGSQRLISLRELLEAERASGIHRAGGVLADPSAAIALVWLRRSLAFQNAVFAGMVEDRASLLSTLARDAYQTHLEHFHNFWLKNAFRAGLSTMPTREDFLPRLGLNMASDEGCERLCPNLERDEERLVYAEMAELVEIQNLVGAELSRLMVELDLDDLRMVGGSEAAEVGSMTFTAEMVSWGASLWTASELAVPPLTPAAPTTPTPPPPAPLPPPPAPPSKQHPSYAPLLSTPPPLGCPPLECAFAALLTLGSPIGCFLSVRGQKLGRSFLLPRRLGRRPTAVFNVFARNDPIAYRLEPLLLEDDEEEEDEAEAEAAGGSSSSMGGGAADTGAGRTGSGVTPRDRSPPLEPPPPVYVPYAGDRHGKRLHIKLRQATSAYLHDAWEVKSRFYHNVFEYVPSAVSGYVPSALSGWFGGGGGGACANSAASTGTHAAAAGDPADAAAAPAPVPAPAPAASSVVWSLNGGGRVDYQLQESELEHASEYLAALKAHNGYWSNPDVAAFVVHEVVGSLASHTNPWTPSKDPPPASVGRSESSHSVDCRL